jgi:hypothetical protein
VSFSQWALGNSVKQFLPPSNFTAEKGVFKFKQTLSLCDLRSISAQLAIGNDFWCSWERNFVLGVFSVG